MERYEFTKQDQWNVLTNVWDKGAYDRVIIIGEDYKLLVDRFWNLHGLMQRTTSMIDWQKYSYEVDGIRKELSQRCNMIVYQILKAVL
jgi:hypothetical protein